MAFMKPRLGLRCVYYPRVPYGRQNKLFCFVSRVVDEDKGIADLIAFPTNSEPVHYNNVAAKSDTIHVHCWESAEADGGDTSALMDMIASLEERISQLEQKRGPGRPPKAEAA